MSSTQRRLLALAAAVGLIATACSSGGGTPSPASEAPAASEPAASETPAASEPAASAATGGAITATPGQSVKMLFLP